MRSIGAKKWPGHYVAAQCVAVVASAGATISATSTTVSIAVLVSAFAMLIMIIGELWAIRSAHWLIGRSVLLAGIFYWFTLGSVGMVLAPEPFSNPSPFYPGFHSHVPLDVAATAVLAVNTFVVSSMFGIRRLAMPVRWVQAIADREDPKSARALEYLALMLAIAAWLPIVYAYQFDVAEFFQRHLQMRAVQTEAQVELVGPLQHTYLLGVFAGSLATVRIIYGRQFNRLIYVVTLALVFPLVFFGGGSRFNLAYLVLPSMLLLAAPVMHSVGFKRRRNTLLWLVLVFLVMFGLQASLRTTGVVANGPEKSMSQLIVAGSEGSDHFGALAVAIDFSERRGELFMEPMWPYFFTHLIPSSFWPGKPYPRSWSEYNDVVTQGQPFNVTPSVIGQYYMNWGLLGVVYIGLFFGSMARFCDDWFVRLDVSRQFASATLAGVCLTFVFLSYRYFSPIYFVYPLFGYACYRVVTHRRS